MIKVRHKAEAEILLLTKNSAHIFKNTWRHVNRALKDAEFNGDGPNRCGNRNKSKLTRALKTALSEACRGVNEEGWTEDQVIARFDVVFDHFTGKHQNCKPGCSKQKLGAIWADKTNKAAQKSKKLLEDHMNQNVEKVMKNGVTSGNEAFNSIPINRRLIVKGENTLAHTASLQVNSAIGLSSIYYNRPEDAKKYIMKNVANWEVNRNFELKATQKAKKKERQKAKKIERKAVKRAQEHAAQAQNQTTSAKRRKMEQDAENLPAYSSCKEINK